MRRFKTGDVHSPHGGPSAQSPFVVSPVGDDTAAGSPFASPRRAQRRIARAPFKVRVRLRAYLRVWGRGKGRKKGQAQSGRAGAGTDATGDVLGLASRAGLDSGKDRARAAIARSWSRRAHLRCIPCLHAFHSLLPSRMRIPIAPFSHS